ncbi:uncharacterized protein LOC135399623 [Ornithodoros turicata]|uniref:uncharacterized protein LOC135399623 n=1 Tax=Ornithodoros turicata TaxID=34597 RepID=UPI003138A316
MASSPNLSPWPQLSELFAVVGEKGENNLLFKCVLCQPKEKILSCARSTHSNLKKHIKAQHDLHLATFERLSKKRSRVAEEPEDVETAMAKQPKLSFAQAAVPQQTVDDAIVAFVVDTMQPYSVVEARSFVNLVKSLAPHSTVVTRRMLTTRISDSYDTMQDRLVSTLEKASHVAVTADCWTTFRRAYLAATVSWLNPESLARKSAVLVCRRMQGKISYDRIADVLGETFERFALHGKITKVVTDNGSNFVKAFRVLGEAAEPKAEDDDLAAEAVDVTALFDGMADGDVHGRVRLPPHQRCSAHTLNLVATVDASKAERHEMFSRPLGSVLRTCRAIWNKQGQSAVAAETIQRYCGRALVRPVSTRWNSFFDAMRCLLELDNAGKDLDGLCRTLQVSPFQRPRDLHFIKEYCAVMKPVACAIDVLQREDISLGYLLPTITVLKKRLEHLAMSGLKFCSPLVHALLEGIQTRFDHMYDDRELLLSTVVIPRFKDRWVDDESRRRELVELLTEEVNRPCYYACDHKQHDASSTHGSTTRLAEEEEEDDYFTFALPLEKEDQGVVVSRYLASSASGSMISLLADHPTIRQVYLRYNTAVPTSAAVERVFSVAADILTRKRGRLADVNFEKQLLLKLNRTINC